MKNRGISVSKLALIQIGWMCVMRKDVPKSVVSCKPPSIRPYAAVIGPVSFADAKYKTSWLWKFWIVIVQIMKTRITCKT